MLSFHELERYARHLSLPEVGLAGQERLKSAKVLCIGVGGLGCVTALYLAAVGIGTLGIIDNETIELSNLQRQILYHTAEVGQSKVLSAKAHLQALNPEVEIVAYDERLTETNILAIFQGFDVIVDGSDNFATRYWVNDACVHLGKPLVSASVLRFQGQLSIFATPEGPCYRCLFPEPPLPDAVPSCREAGVLGVLPGTMGTLQATEVIKWILQQGHCLLGKVLFYDALTLQCRVSELKRDPACLACSERRDFTALPRPSEKTTMSMCAVSEISATELKAWQQAGKDFFLLDVRQPHEYAMANLGGHLIPLSELPQRVSELDPERCIVVHCKAGTRSQQAVNFLKTAGFHQLFSLTGGINAWREQIDPSLPPCG